MKLTLLLALVAVAWWAYAARNRRLRAAAAAEALARQRAARRSRVPAVSNNLKGVTASQTIEAYRSPGVADDERVA
jgi:Flp pilus assembly protein TadB